MRVKSLENNSAKKVTKMNEVRIKNSVLENNNVKKWVFRLHFFSGIMVLVTAYIMNSGYLQKPVRDSSKVDF